MNNFISNAISGTMNVLGQVGNAINNPFLAKQQNAMGNIVAPQQFQSTAPVQGTSPFQSLIPGVPSVTKGAPSNSSTGASNTNDFSSAFSKLTPTEQATYTKANPNVDTTTGQPKTSGNQVDGYTATNSNAPMTPYKVDLSNITSQALAGNTSQNDVLTRRQQYENQYMDAYNKYAEASLNQKSTAVQNMGNVQNALYSGNTTDYGQGAAGVAQNAANISNALAEIKTQGPLLAAQGMSNMLGFVNQDIQNQLATVPNLQNVQQAADGSIIGFVRDPLTGAVKSQNFGNPLLGTFSNQGQTGANIGGGASQQSLDSNGGTITLPANGDGTYQTPSGGSVNQYYAQQISSMTPAYQSYVLPGPEGTAYIDGSRISQLPAQIQMQIQKESAKAGIPFLDQTAAAGLQSVYSLYNTLNKMQELVNQTLKPGPGGAVIDWAKSTLNSVIPVYPELGNFNNLRTLAGQADTNLMGGIGSGFRQNTANLSISVANLPEARDSLQQANQKIQATRALLDQSMLKTFPGFKGTGSLTSNGAVAPSNQTYVQTKVGAIPTNW